jgi:bacterioferritin
MKELTLESLEISLRAFGVICENYPREELLGKCICPQSSSSFYGHDREQFENGPDRKRHKFHDQCLTYKERTVLYATVEQLLEERLTKNMKEFLTDVKTLRENARKNMGKGPVTDAYGADAKKVIEVLNQSLATEIICVLRYQQHFFTAKGLNSESVAAEFLQHSREEQGHAEKIAARISQLGGSPDFNPDSLSERAHSQYETATDLVEMIKENLVAERIAVSSYTEIVAWLGNDDPTTRRMIEEILAVEEEHAEDMVNLLDGKL